MSVSVENVLDKIAELLIENFQTVEEKYNISLTDAQKTISAGQVVVGVEEDWERLVLYQDDTKANLSDSNLEVINQIANEVLDLQVLNEAQLILVTYDQETYEPGFEYPSDMEGIIEDDPETTDVDETYYPTAI